MAENMSIALCFWIGLAVVQLASISVRADYVVEVHVQSYSNPTNRAVGQGGDCCDPVPGADSNCSKLELCDSYFTFCLRPLNTSHTQRGCDTPNITSEVASNNDSIDFTNSTFLGITNPFHLNASGPWQGVQLYVEVIDRDFNTLFADTVEDDLIESFDFHLGISSIFETNISITKEGTYGTIGIMARVLCAPLFTGPNCEYCIEQNCSTRGVCVSEELLTCACDPGYTGSACETTINDCASQNCNGNGMCVGENSPYRCECNHGFTGDNCETNIDECEDQNCSGNGHCLDGIGSYRCDCQSGFTGKDCETFNYCAGVNCSGNGQCFNRENNFTCLCQHGFTGELCSIEFQIQGVRVVSGEVAGGLAAVLAVFLLVIIVLLVVIAFLVKKKTTLKKTPEASPTAIHTYEFPSPEKPLEVQSETPNEHQEPHSSTVDAEMVTFDNTIYGSLTSVDEAGITKPE